MIDDKFTVVYGFDNISEFDFWKLSFRSLLKSNGEKVNVLTIVLTKY